MTGVTVCPPKSQYHKIPNWLSQSDLPWHTKVVGIYLASVPPNWSTNARKIAQQIGIGKNSAKKGLRMLERLGVLSRETVRDDGGRIAGQRYTLDLTIVPETVEGLDASEPCDRETDESRKPVDRETDESTGDRETGDRETDEGTLANPSSATLDAFDRLTDDGTGAPLTGAREKAELVRLYGSKTNNDHSHSLRSFEWAPPVRERAREGGDSLPNASEVEVHTSKTPDEKQSVSPETEASNASLEPSDWTPERFDREHENCTTKVATNRLLMQVALDHLAPEYDLPNGASEWGLIGKLRNTAADFLHNARRVGYRPTDAPLPDSAAEAVFLLIKHAYNNSQFDPSTSAHSQDHVLTAFFKWATKAISNRSQKLKEHQPTNDQRKRNARRERVNRSIDTALENL